MILLGEKKMRTLNPPTGKVVWGILNKKYIIAENSTYFFRLLFLNKKNVFFIFTSCWRQKKNSKYVCFNGNFSF